MCEIYIIGLNPENNVRESEETFNTIVIIIVYFNLTLVKIKTDNFLLH
jgi:hypothetical protein